MRQRPGGRPFGEEKQQPLRRAAEGQVGMWSGVTGACQAGHGLNTQPAGLSQALLEGQGGLGGLRDGGELHKEVASDHHGDVGPGGRRLRSPPAPAPAVPFIDDDPAPSSSPLSEAETLHSHRRLTRARGTEPAWREAAGAKRKAETPEPGRGEHGRDRPVAPRLRPCVPEASLRGARGAPPRDSQRASVCPSTICTSRGPARVPAYGPEPRGRVCHPPVGSNGTF